MRRIVLFLLLLGGLACFAQPNSGFKGGMNVSWVKGDTEYNEYSGQIGYNVGYAWRINCSKKVSISIEGMFNRKSVRMKYYSWQTARLFDSSYREWSERRSDAFYVSAPVGCNYMITSRFYVAGGYEFGYNLHELFGDLYGNEYDHAGYLGAGFHTRYFDFVVRYVRSLNQESEITSWNYLPDGTLESFSVTERFRTNTFQFSFILSLGRKNKKE